MFRDDLTYNAHSRCLSVSTRHHHENLALALDLFELRAARDLGVRIHLEGSVAGTSYSTLFIPRSLEEAEYAMIGQVKYCIPTSPPTVVLDVPIERLRDDGFLELTHTRAEARARLAR